MRAKLEILSGSLEGEEFLLEGEEVTLGRVPDCDVVFREADPTVSRVHAILRFHEGDSQWTVQDKASTNGTFLNGEPIEQGREIELSHGDEIVFGREGPKARFTLLPSETELVVPETQVVARDTEIVKRGERGSQLPRAELEILSGSRQGETIALESDEIAIGRNPGCDVIFRDDLVVGRSHANIRKYDRGSLPEDLHWLSESDNLFPLEGWCLIDEGSRNGTLLNGQRLEPGVNYVVDDGDEITFGATGPVARFLVRRRVGAETRVRDTTVPYPGNRAGAEGGSSSEEDGATIGARQGHEPTVPWEDATEDRRRPVFDRVRALFGAVLSAFARRKGTTWIMTNVPDWEERLRLLYARQKRKMWRAVAATAGLGIVVAGGFYLKGQKELRRVRDQAKTYIQNVEHEAQDSRAHLQAQLATSNSRLKATQSQLSQMKAAYSAIKRGQDQQLREFRDRLGFTGALAREYRSSVAMVDSRVVFVDPATRRRVRAAVDAHGDPIKDGKGHLVPTLEGDGPVLAPDECCGTAFLIDKDGWLLTNRHVLDAEDLPWLVNEATELGKEVGTAVRPQFIDSRVYFPPGNVVRDIDVVALSDSVEVGLARIHGQPVDRPPIPLAPPTVLAPVGGDVGVIGYPDATELLCLRTYPPPPECQGKFPPLDPLARRGLVEPFVQRGAVSSVTGTQIVFNLTGASAGGSSGSPVLDANRHVVGINWGGGQFGDGRPGGVSVSMAVPIRYAWELLPGSVRRDLEARAAARSDERE